MRAGWMLAAFLVVLALPPLASAADLGLAVTPDRQAGAPGTLAVYRLAVTNNRDGPDNVTLRVSGQHLEWFQDGVYLLIPVAPKSTFTSRLSLYPVGDVYGTFAYTLTAVSLFDPARTASSAFALDVTYGGKEALLSIAAAMRGGDVLLTFRAASPVRKVLSFTVKIADVDGDSIGTFTVQEEVENVETFEKTVTLQKGLPPGTYTVTASLQGSEEKKTAVFVIGEVRKITTEETVVHGNWYDEVVVTVTNTGNVPEKDYLLSYPVPADRLTGFVTATEGCVIEGAQKTCGFRLQPLAPGETARVVYRIEYWPSLAGFAAGGVLLALLAGFAFVAASRPRIIKRVVRRKGGVTHVVLEVRSPRLRDAHAVVVRDFVTPLAEVLHREFESLKPVVRKTEAGTELIWKVGDMKPREQRMFSYKMKPLVEGQLRMPRAYLKYSTPDEKRYQIFSRGVAV